MRDDAGAAGGVTLLLVEDDPAIGSVLCRALLTETYGVEWVKSAASARAALAARRFAAVLLDRGLPDGDGLALCRDARAAGLTTPIMMLTARSEVEDRLEGFASGADDHVAKPFALAELLVRLGVMLARSASAHRLEIAALAIDLKAQTAALAGEPLALSRREFAVLAALAAEAGQPMSRAALIDAAWGPGGDVTENAVDVYIGYLRRLLAGHAAAPEIANVRGVGFVLRPKHEPI